MTGIKPQGNTPSRADATRHRPPPTGERQNDQSGEGRIQPAPDNSFDRRADFANAHRARASVARGFGEAPQQSYTGKTPVPPGELDPDLARTLGIDEREENEEDSRNVITPDMGPAHLRLRRPGRGEVATVAGLASQQSLDRLLREGRPEFRRSIVDAASAAAARKVRRRITTGDQI